MAFCLYRIGWAIVAAGALSAIAACATITQGSSQVVTISTDPPGATCELTRAGMTLGVARPTPGMVHIEKDAEDIVANCSMDGFQDTSGVLSSKFEGAALGNILLGGVIGFAIDAGSGALNEYPSSMLVVMIPNSFASEEERDIYFDRIIESYEARSRRAVAVARKNCFEDETSDCDRKVRAIESRRETELAEFERKRRSAEIGVASWSSRRPEYSAGGFVDPVSLMTDDGFTMFATTARGRSIVVFYASDGAQAIDYGSGADVGEWRIEGDSLCTRWDRIRAGAERCIRIRREDGEYAYYHDDDSFGASFTVTPGNPRNL